MQINDTKPLFANSSNNAEPGLAKLNIDLSSPLTQSGAFQNARACVPPLTNLACWLGAGLLMALICYRLFSGMTEVGMQGFDTFLYWKNADHLLHGQIDFNTDRLFFHALNALAMKTLGANDYALRSFISAAAVLNIGLVFLLSYRVSANAVVALTTTAVYAFNPTIFLYSGMELPHIYGATLVLAAAISALYTIDSTRARCPRLVFAGLTGFFLALATFTHEDLIFLAFAFAALLGLMNPRNGSMWARSNLLSVVYMAVYFRIGFPTWSCGADSRVANRAHRSAKGYLRNGEEH